MTQANQLDSFENGKFMHITQAHSACLQNLYHPKDNPQGIINFGTSVNLVIIHTTKKYLPSWIKMTDFLYPDQNGKDPEFNPRVSQKTFYTPDETKTYNGASSIISGLCYSYKNVHFLTDITNKSAILSHSRAVEVPAEQAGLIISAIKNQEQVKNILQKYQNKPKLFVLDSQKDVSLLNRDIPKLAVTYNHSLKENLQFGVAQTTDPQLLEHIIHEWPFFVAGNIIKRASISDAEITTEDSGPEHIIKMIEVSSGVIVPKQNMIVGIGAGSALNLFARALFQGGNFYTCSPYYVGFDHDFAQSGVKMVGKPRIGSTVLERIQQAEKQGGVGYVVCNPNNPLGTMITKEQVVEICEWAKDFSHFHLFFDEMYLSTCRFRQTRSAADYAIKMQNIHVIRGFAKDFGICGFKIGMGISSNKKVLQKFAEWQPFYSHQPFEISFINSMLKKSNNGLDIIQPGKQLLRQYFNIITKQLDDAGIQYIKPEAGTFVFADFRKYLQNLTQQEEQTFWKRLFYKHKVNLSGGLFFHAQSAGYFRICPITDLQTMTEGLRRIKAAITELE